MVESRVRSPRRRAPRDGSRDAHPRRLRAACVAAALGWIALSAGPIAAQEKDLSTREIQTIYQSFDSHERHETWKRLNPENSTHYKIILQILKKKTWHDRDGAIIALAKAFSDDVVGKMIKDLEKNRDPFVRQGMALALAKMNDPKFYPNLYEALDDSNPFVRRVVVHSLRVHKKPEAVDALIARFREEEDPVVRTFIEDTLNEITQAYQGPDPVAWDLWWTQAKSDPDYELGTVDEETIEQAERLGRKLRERKTVSTSGGVTLDSSERGSGDGIPILILPPYGYSKKIMLPFLSELEKNHKLYYIDLPPIKSFKGLTTAGRTSIPYYPIDRLVEAFEDLRQKTDQERFALMSCGMNTWIAMKYAQLYPESVAANIFISPISSQKEFGSATDRMIRGGRANRMADKELMWLGLSRQFNSNTGESALDTWHKDEDEPKPDGQGGSIDRRAWSLFFQNEQDSTISLLYPVKNHPMGSVAIPDFSLFTEDRPARPIPTLVFVGQGTLYTSVDDCQEIAKYYRTRPIVMKYSADMPFAEESEKFNTYVGKFLAKYARPEKKD